MFTRYALDKREFGASMLRCWRFCVRHSRYLVYIGILIHPYPLDRSYLPHFSIGLGAVT